MPPRETRARRGPHPASRIGRGGIPLGRARFPAERSPGRRALPRPFLMRLDPMRSLQRLDPSTVRRARAAALGLLLAGAAQSQGILWRHVAVADGDNHGRGVDVAGDCNGDGVPDLVVGAPGHRAPHVDQGRVVLYSGSTGAILFSWLGSAANDDLGFSVAGAGDVDGDGYDDVIAGAPHNDGLVAAGHVKVWSGRTGAVIWTFNGVAIGDTFGQAVDGAGDVDADGFADLIVGAPNNDTAGTTSGAAYLYSGRTGALIRAHLGASVPEYFGQSVAGAGDVDRDGFDDVIVGGPSAMVGGSPRGRAVVYSGRTGAALWTLNGTSLNDRFGSSVAGGGDADRDGWPDLLVGAPDDDDNGSNSGTLRLVSGRTGTLIRTLVGSVRFGTACAFVGDLDGDGHSDLAGSESMASSGLFFSNGAVRCFSGRTGAAIVTFEGESDFASLGEGLGGSLAADFDGDGLDDVVAGAFLWSDGVINPGAAYVFDAGRSGTPARVRSVRIGCVGSNSRLPTALSRGTPGLGVAFALALRGALPNALTVLNLGTATQVPLASFGMPGCELLATADGFSVPHVCDANGVAASTAITVPNSIALIGIELGAQWICVDGAANAAGLTASDGLVLRIGS